MFNNLCTHENYYSLGHDRGILLKIPHCHCIHTIHKNYKMATMYAFTKWHVCIYKDTIEKSWQCVCVCVHVLVRACVRVRVRAYQILASFSSLFGSCYAVHINALSIIMKDFIKKKNIQIELIRFRKKYRLFHVNFCEARYSTRLACLRLDSRYNISMFNSNHINYPWHVATVLCTKLARKVLPRCACSISANLTIICYSSLSLAV